MECLIEFSIWLLLIVMPRRIASSLLFPSFSQLRVKSFLKCSLVFAKDPLVTDIMLFPSIEVIVILLANAATVVMRILVLGMGLYGVLYVNLLSHFSAVR